jgi:hypothetical protein
MLQPPNTLKTVLSPGLTPDESYSQFKLWVLMKSPLVLGTNWEQLADLQTLEPTYYNLLTNKEMLAINQDMSPQGELVRQFPSKAQQSGNGAYLTNKTVPVSYQLCDSGRASQRWAAGSAVGSVQLEGTTLCLGLTDEGTGVELAPCSATSTPFGMRPDEQVHVGQVGASGKCLSANPANPLLPTPTVEKCIYTGPIPPTSVFAPSFGTQAHVWGRTTAQIVETGNSMCMTAGLPNIDPTQHTWATNNGTLEHEVWMGDLTPTGDAPRRVVALFNKGGSADELIAPASLYAREIAAASAANVKVRDVVNHKDVSVRADGAIDASVPRHGVALFVVTFGTSTKHA